MLKGSSKGQDQTSPNARGGSWVVLLVCGVVAIFLATHTSAWLYGIAGLNFTAPVVDSYSDFAVYGLQSAALKLGDLSKINASCLPVSGLVHTVCKL